MRCFRFAFWRIDEAAILSQIKHICGCSFGRSALVVAVLPLRAFTVLVAVLVTKLRARLLLLAGLLAAIITVTVAIVVAVLVTIVVTVAIAIGVAVRILRLFARLLLLALLLIARLLVAVVLLVLVTLGLPFAVFPLLLFAALVNLALGFGQHAQVMFRMLLEIFHRNAVIAKLGVARQLVVFVDDLLRGAAHLAFGTGAVEHAVDDITDTTVWRIGPARLA